MNQTFNTRQSNRSLTNTKNYAFIFISLKPIVKAIVKAIVINAYCRGLVTTNITEWIIRKGGLRHV